MTFSRLDMGVLVAYLAVVIVFGMWIARKTVVTKKDYFLAGDKLSWWVIGGSMVAANISTHHFVGIMGLAKTSLEIPPVLGI
jgi:solute:Na+ symporter, SSS family